MTFMLCSCLFYLLHLPLFVVKQRNWNDRVTDSTIFNTDFSLCMDLNVTSLSLFKFDADLLSPQLSVLSVWIIKEPYQCRHPHCIFESRRFHTTTPQCVSQYALKNSSLSLPPVFPPKLHTLIVYPEHVTITNNS